MDKFSNYILIFLFVLIVLCIAIPIIFVSKSVSYVCITVGIVVLFVLNGIVNFVLNKDNERK